MCFFQFLRMELAETYVCAYLPHDQHQALAADKLKQSIADTLREEAEGYGWSEAQIVAWGDKFEVCHVARGDKCECYYRCL